MPEPTEPLAMPFTILVDRREKLPYGFHGIRGDQRDDYRPLVVPMKTVHLPTGDYTIEGIEDLVAVERKSKADLYTTLGQHRERFQDEHRRMAAMHSAIVVIEADWQNVLLRPPRESQLLPKVISRTEMSWWIHYGVRWHFAGSRRAAELYTFQFLRMFWRKAAKATGGK